MKKELIICLIIIAGIIIGDICLQKYTVESFNNISYKLSEMKASIDNEDENKSRISEINNLWDGKFNILTCFLEHDELEKIRTQLVVITAAINVKDTESAYEEIDKAIYLLEHIREKQSFKIDNIF